MEDFLKDLDQGRRADYDKLDEKTQRGCFNHWMATEGHHLNYSYLAELFFKN